ncbi:hypothetical protein [Nocardia sp. BMG51109]|uniref:hypothetical protein n=1 Tax=Nocardia sp. BMG51109 TaxID=1056816 RepID=UPI0004636BA3|nr:hypothetical protein [Nocardia sp. BMG51109]
MPSVAQSTARSGRKVATPDASAPAARTVADHGAPTRVPFDAEHAPPAAPVTIPESHDRLVRHLFDIGLRLHTVRAVFDQEFSSPDDVRAAREAVSDVLGDLDTIIRDAGVAMLEVARQQSPAPAPDRPRRRRRR